MPSIKQIIAEVQIAADLGPNQKQFVVKTIHEAEQRLTLKLIGTKIRKISNAKGLITLDEWEERNNVLTVMDVKDWAEKHQLCSRMLAQMIIEFRAEMMAKGKQYANFRLAFQTYLTKGYLSKKLTECTIELSPFRRDTMLDNRGVNL